MTRLIDEVWNQGNMNVVDELVGDEYVYHDPQNPEGRGPDGYKDRVSMYRTAMPDIHFSIHDSVVSGDRVAIRWSVTGTQTGDLPDIPATGKTSTVTGIGILRLSDGKVVEEWQIWDTLGMLENLGVVPT